MNGEDKVNKDVCDSLVNMDFTNYNYICKSLGYESGDVYNYTMIKNYCKIMKNNNYEIEKIYTYRDTNKELRMYVEGYGLQKMTAIFRDALVSGIYTDYDIVNSQPSLILYILKKNHCDTSMMYDYITERDKILNELMELYDIPRWESKRLILKSINSPYIINKVNKKIVKKNSWLNRFNEYCISIQIQLENRYKDFVKILKTKKDYHAGKLMNMLYTKLESKILNMIRDKYNVKVPIFDGFLTDQKIPIDELIALTNQYGITWTNKEVKNEIMEYLKSNGKETLFGLSPIDIRDKILNGILLNKYFMEGGNRYMKVNGEWTDNKNRIKHNISNILKNFDIYVGEENKYKPVNTNSGITGIENEIYKNPVINDEFSRDIYENTKYKLVFQDGYFDFKLNKYIKEDIDSFVAINKVLDFERNEIVRQEIYDNVLNPIFSVVESRNDYNERIILRDYFLYKMSRIMAGHIEDKNWVLMLGLRDSGKGVLMDFFGNCFEKYISTTDAGSFRFKSNNGAKNNSWIIDFIHRRLCLVSEIPMENMTDSIDGNMIKKFCSGGDEIEGRQNYMDERKFKIQSSLVICCNDLPKINPADALEKAIPIDMKTKFVDMELESNAEVVYWKKNDWVKTDFIRKPEIMNEFILMILEAYNNQIEYPKELLEKFMEEGDDDDDQKLYKLFRKNPDAEVEYDDIKYLCKASNIHITQRMIIKKLKIKYSCISRKSNGKYILIGIEKF